MKKISYERRAYESVDEKSLSIGYVPKNDEKKNLVHKGLRVNYIMMHKIGTIKNSIIQFTCQCPTILINHFVVPCCITIALVNKCDIFPS